MKDNPLTGVGPDTVRMVYPHYRDPEAVQQLNSHLHNVPLQIAAERGIPALLLWLGSCSCCCELLPAAGHHDGPVRRYGCSGLDGRAPCRRAVEYNFGDSEFLMLFLVVVTLPFAADRGALPAPTVTPS